MTTEESVYDGRSKQKAAELAARIIQLSRKTLLLNPRFMDSAIFRLSPKAADTTLTTDGRCVYCGDAYVLRWFKVEQALVVRDLLRFSYFNFFVFFKPFHSRMHL